MKIPLKQTDVLIEELVKLERRGQYEEALAELEDIWSDKTMAPNVEGFEPRVAGELLLRCGSLFGFLGHIRQIPKAQEKSKNLLTEARQIFLDIYDPEKIAECENYIALAYWRNGEVEEAQTWVEEALSHNLPKDSFTRLYLLVNKSLIIISRKKFEEGLEFCRSYQDDIYQIGDDFLKGCFSTNFAIILKNLSFFPEAIKKYELAKKYHERSGHKSYLGTVQNNLACFYKSEEKFEEAHRAIDKAIKIFSKIKDRTREGFSLDTKAQIYLAEGKLEKALETIDTAIEIQLNSENSAYRVETYLTKAKILVALDDISAGTLALLDGVQIAKANISEEAAENLAQEFELEIFKKTKPFISRIYTETEFLTDDDLELILPSSIAHYRYFQAIRIKNNHLEKIGIKPEMLAIIVNEKVEKGDLVAIAELKDDAVRCGYYDEYFGVVCLEGIGSEPLLLNENEINLLGKIVGFCDPKKKVDGKLEVIPI